MSRVIDIDVDQISNDESLSHSLVDSLIDDSFSDDFYVDVKKKSSYKK